MSITPKFDYTNFKKQKMMNVIRPIGNLFCKTYYKVEFEGLENINRTDAFIIAPNHVTEFDPLFVAMASKRLFYYIAKSELFKNPLLNKAIRSLNGFPIVRGIGDKNALNYAIEVIRRGEVLCIFPEWSGTTPAPSEPPMLLHKADWAASGRKPEPLPEERHVHNEGSRINTPLPVRNISGWKEPSGLRVLSREQPSPRKGSPKGNILRQTRVPGSPPDIPAGAFLPDNWYPSR